MRDFTAGHIATSEAEQLLLAAQRECVGEGWEFRPGISYRNLLLYRGGAGRSPFSGETRTTPPHDLTDQSVADDYPRGPGSDLLNEIMHRSVDCFGAHPVNEARRQAGRLAATNVWLWGLGRRPRLRPFAEAYGKRGVMITAVDLLRGLAALMGWPRVEVPGATGYTDTDYGAKGRYAVAALPTTDLVCVHIEATDEASHEGDVQAKIEALEQIDRHVVAPLLSALRDQGAYRILVTPDHPTPVRTKTHSHGAVPFAICGSGIQSDGASTYDEPSADGSALAFDQGWRLMSFFLSSHLQA